nr:hypothetical protein [Tanacetum cinerariifolium]
SHFLKCGSSTALFRSHCCQLIKVYMYSFNNMSCAPVINAECFLRRRLPQPLPIETTVPEHRLTLYVNLSEMELKKILIDKMEGNKSIQRSDEQRNLYKALVKAYDADKTILDSYGESTILKRRCKDDDDQEGPFAGSDRGPKRQREGGEHASASTLFEPATRKEPVQTTCQMEEPSHLVFEIGAEDLPIVQTSQHPEWFFQPKKPPTPDRDWNRSLPAAQVNAQS